MPGNERKERETSQRHSHFLLSDTISMRCNSFEIISGLTSFFYSVETLRVPTICIRMHRKRREEIQHLAKRSVGISVWNYLLKLHLRWLLRLNGQQFDHSTKDKNDSSKWSVPRAGLFAFSVPFCDILIKWRSFWQILAQVSVSDSRMVSISIVLCNLLTVLCSIER